MEAQKVLRRTRKIATTLIFEAVVSRDAGQGDSGIIPCREKT
jgi:hypothetical protein